MPCWYIYARLCTFTYHQESVIISILSAVADLKVLCVVLVEYQ